MDQKQIYHFISRILSLGHRPENPHFPIPVFPDEEDDWRKVVEVGNRHLLLPTLYHALSRLNSTGQIPPDLDSYLEKVFLLNKERNLLIINQAKHIIHLLKSQGIKVVLMKGLGNIADGLYTDPGERMLYDLDLLLEKNNLITAAEILQSDGFATVKPYNPDALESTMHYPAMVSENWPAAVELHQSPVQYLYEKYFNNQYLENDIRPALTDNEFLVMSDRHKIIHNFIHSQLMHSRHYSATVPLRDLYDLYLLSEKVNPEDVFTGFDHFRNETKAYLKLCHRYFGLNISPELQRSASGNELLRRSNMVLKMSRRVFRVYYLILIMTQKYFLLPVRLIWNKKARNYVFARLGRKSWYKSHFRGMKKMIKG